MPKFPSEPVGSPHSMTCVGRFSRLVETREIGLVLAARGVPYWIERAGSEWILLVEETRRNEAESELRAFADEQSRSPRPTPDEALRPWSSLSLFVAAWILSAFFFLQKIQPESWTERGLAESSQITAGAWWRAVTALTLHADLMHLVANLITGLIFAGLLLPRIGAGWTWLGITLGGSLGNFLNAWNYHAQTHLSLGASTACFAGLGMLVGWETVARWQVPATRNRWQLILPLGAGLALLAFLGAADQEKSVDFLAHFWGLIVGLIEGAGARVARLGAVENRMATRLAAAASVILVAGAWWLAMHSGGN